VFILELYSLAAIQRSTGIVIPSVRPPVRHTLVL